MRHRKHTFKVGRNCGHRRSLIANMLKALVEQGRIETSVTKAKELKRHADKLVTLAKDNTLASRRRAISKLMISYNPLTTKEARAAKGGDRSSFNTDRRVIDILFNDLSKRFADRNGGYTRLIRSNTRVGDCAPMCIVEYIAE